MRQLIKCDQCEKFIKKHGGGFNAELSDASGEKKVITICRECARNAGYKV